MVSADAIPALPVEVAALKDEGNDYFRAGDFLKAAGSYTKAIKVCTRFSYCSSARLIFSFLSNQKVV